MSSSFAATPATTKSVDRPALRVLALCWFVVLLDGLDLFVYGGVLPGLLADKGFGLTPALGGEIGSFATFGLPLGTLGSGIITDRIGRKKIILAGVVIFSLASAACAMAPTVGAFGAARFVAGIGLGGLLPTAIAMVIEFAPPRRKTFSVGGALAGVLARGAAAGHRGAASAVCGEVADSVAEPFVDGPAEADGLVFAGLLGRGRGPGQAGQGLSAGRRRVKRAGR